MNKKYKHYLIAFALLFIGNNIIAEDENKFGILDSKLIEIENKVSSMNYNQLIASRSNLVNEIDELEERSRNTQNPSRIKNIKQHKL